MEGTWDVAMRMFGTQGDFEAHYDAPVRITGRNPGSSGPRSSGPDQGRGGRRGWGLQGALDDADAMKEQHFIESITSGKFINEAAQGAESTLSAMLGRYAAYTGRTWSWTNFWPSPKSGTRASTSPICRREPHGGPLNRRVEAVQPAGRTGVEYPQPHSPSHAFFSGESTQYSASRPWRTARITICFSS